jgi:hypothetical protein
MAKVVSFEKPGRTKHGTDVRRLLMKAWAAATFLGPRAPLPSFIAEEERAGRPRSQAAATPAAVAQQRRRTFTEAPALRNCLRCSKLECSTS